MRVIKRNGPSVWRFSASFGSGVAVDSEHRKPVDVTEPMLSIGFRTSIITLFVAILLFVGLSLVYLSFRRATFMTEVAAARFLERVSEHTADRIDAQFKDVQDNLHVLKQLPSIQNAAINDPALHALMAAMLRGNDHLFNSYVGYDDGAFLQMDVIDRAGEDYRRRLSAPPDAKFRLLVMRAGSDVDGNRRADVRYLSDDLVVVTSLSQLDNFDPRTRPWFIGARDPGARTLTDPYIFRATGLPGYTIRTPIASGQGGVVAGDVLLTDAEAFLRQQQLGMSGRAILFDDEGRVIAFPGLSDRLRKTGRMAVSVELPTLVEIDPVDVTNAIKAWHRSGSVGQIFRGFDGRAYAAAFRSIGTAGAAKLRLVVLAPLEEFFADIEHEKQRLFAITLAFVLGLVPIAFWIGSMMSGRLQLLAAETDRIRRFEFAETPPLRSVIREIDDLGRSTHTLRSVIQTFARFVPRRLVEQVVEASDGVGLGGTRREVTVLFTDVRDFTSITEHEDPERVMIFTSRYFAALSHAIMETGGVVDKFIGDSVMALWNATSDQSDHVRSACEAILDCLDVNLELNRAFSREGWPSYQTRFGLHVGPALVGNIGSSDRMNFTALGATVNLASRLEGLNKVYGTSVLVTEEIRDIAEQYFIFRFVDRVRPKGFDDEVNVYELRCRSGPHTLAEAAFCSRWNAMFDVAVPFETGSSLEAFLDAYPDDELASRHADRIRTLRQIEKNQSSGPDSF